MPEPYAPMPHRRRTAIRRLLPRLLAGTAVCVAFSVLPAAAQTLPEPTISNSGTILPDARSDAELRPGSGGIERRLPAPRSGLLTRDEDELTQDERELLDELYEEETEDEDGADESEPPANRVAPFDVFSGPDTSASAPSDPAAPVPTTEIPTRLNGDEAAASEASDPDVSNAAALPAGREGDDEDPEALLSNPPLQAGIADETLPANSLIESNAPARAIERIVRGPADDQPFAPVGLRVRTLDLYPEFYQGVGVSSNLDEEAGGSGGAFSETEINLQALSNWARHEGEMNARLAYRYDFGADNPENPDAALDGRLRFDLGALTSATLRGAVRYRKDDPFSAGADFAEEDPEILSSSASAEIDHEIARFLLTGGATLAREAYLSQPEGIPDLGYTTATATARGAYRISPAFAPFLSASLGRRVFDDGARLGGEALIPSVRAGALIDIAEKLRGEIGLGYAWNRPESGETISSPTIDGLLTWSPRRGTDLVLEARTTFEPDDIEGSSTEYEASLAILHAVNASVDLNGAIRTEFESRETDGSDPFGLAAEIGVTYWLNRTLSFVALYEYERRFEADRRDDWQAHTVSLGVRLQR